MLRRRCRVGDAAWAEAGTAIDQLAVCQRLQRFSELAWRVDDEGLQGDDGGAFGFSLSISSPGWAAATILLPFLFYSFSCMYELI